MKKINHNDLIPWFTEDQSQLPAAYVASCQRFFLELDRRQADKQQATSLKETWICEECSIKFKKFTEEVNHLLDKVVCDKCYKQQAPSFKLQAPSLTDGEG